MKNSKIEWCDHTFNPWWGCSHAGTPGCDHCYAASWAARCGKDCFGPGKPRLTFGEKHWAEPLRWDEEAKAAGKRAIVFGDSMCDWMDMFGPSKERDRLVELIKETSYLFWLLCTKRPENINWMPKIPNLGLGVTVETQEQVWRIAEILKVEAALYFVSAEPMLGTGEMRILDKLGEGKIEWVICGGESGPKARPLYQPYVRDLRDQCIRAGAPFFFKSWGEWAPIPFGEEGIRGKKIHRFDPFNSSCRVGKKAAGRMLDGREWNEKPSPLTLPFPPKGAREKMSEPRMVGMEG